MLVKMRVSRDAPRVARDEITELPDKFALMWIELGWCDAVEEVPVEVPVEDLIPEIEPKKRR